MKISGRRCSVPVSLDGKKFKQVRMFHLLNDCPEVKIGAYACSPQRDDFEAILSQIDFE